MDSSYSEAVQEAYASVGTDFFLINTLSLYYDGLKDADGNDTELYIYNNKFHTHIGDNGESILRAKLEDGNEVDFISLSFNFKLPNITTDPIQQAQLSIDNVSRTAMDLISKAVELEKSVKLSYRLYLSDNLTLPQNDPPLELWLEQPSITDTTFTANVSSRLFTNHTFPSNIYDPQLFKGLQQ